MPAAADAKLELRGDVILQRYEENKSVEKLEANEILREVRIECGTREISPVHEGVDEQISARKVRKKAFSRFFGCVNRTLGRKKVLSMWVDKYI